MITFHQSINGDKDGSYAMLATSMADQQEARRFSNLTDMRARPAEGIEWSPVIRGFAYDKFYIFLKTFKDQSPGVRAGRIFSHALIAEKKDLPYINDLGRVLELMPTQADQRQPLNPLTADTLTYATGTVPSPSRRAKAINALLRLDEYNKTIVWVGHEGFEELIVAIWTSVPASIREQIRFDVAFKPNEIDTSKVNIVWIPVATTAHWTNTNFCIVHPTDEETLEGPAAFYLAGDKTEGNSIAKVIKALNILSTDLNDFIHLQRIANVLYEQRKDMHLGDYLIAGDLISKFSPDPAMGTTEKRAVLDRISSLISSGSANEISGLGNVNWTGFGNAQSRLQPLMEQWMNKHLLSGGGVNTLAIVRKLTSQDKNWWHKVMENTLKKLLGSWQRHYAARIWDWWNQDPKLVEGIDKLIPSGTDVQSDIIDAFPRSVSKGLANLVVTFASNRQWLILHGIALLKIYPASEAIEKQLAVDVHPESMEPIRRMVQEMEASMIITMALKSNHDKLTLLAGERAAVTPSLLTGFDAANPAWIKIWTGSLKKGGDPWIGINAPRSVMFSIMDRLRDGQATDERLLLRLSSTQWADLSEYPHRKEIWKLLAGKTKQNFLLATVHPIIRSVRGSDVRLSRLDAEIRGIILQTDVFTSILQDDQVQGFLKIQLFDEIPELRANLNALRLLVDRFQLNRAEAIMLGRIIAKHHWRDAAYWIADREHVDSNVRPALTECKFLLDKFKKLTLYWRGSKEESPSPDEWWQDFLDICKNIYPRGPGDRGLWARAGGDDANLQVHGSGLDIWTDALRRLRYRSFSGITTEKLLDIMITENRNNQELPILRELYKKL